MNENRTIVEAQRIQKMLTQFKHDVRQWEREDEIYMKYFEGSIDSAIAVLGNISGEYNSVSSAVSYSVTKFI